MAGDAKNTALWEGADVYIDLNGTAPAPTDTITAWDTAWRPVGLLDGEEGFTESREEESSEHHAWGGILYRRTKSKHKRTIKFVALEDNDITFALRNPGSTRSADPETGLRTSVVKVPTGTHQFSIGFETRDGDRVRRRYVKTAEVVEIGEIKESETEPTVFEITVVILPESDGVLYTDIEDDPGTATTPGDPEAAGV